MSQPVSSLSLLSRISGVFPIAVDIGDVRLCTMEHSISNAVRRSLYVPPTNPLTVPWALPNLILYGRASSEAVARPLRKRGRNIVRMGGGQGKMGDGGDGGIGSIEARDLGLL